MDESLDQVVMRNKEFTRVEVKKSPKEKEDRRQKKPESLNNSRKREWDKGVWDWRCALNEF